MKKRGNIQVKVTIDYNYIDKHKRKVNKYFLVSDIERKMPKDYFVFCVLTVKKVDYFMIIYNKKLVFAPDFIIKVVDNHVEDDWEYINYKKKYVIDNIKGKIKVTTFLGPVMFLRDKKIIIDILNEKIGEDEFKFFYLYNIAYQSKGKYAIHIKENSLTLFSVVTKKILVNDILKIKINRHKNELYVITNEDEFFIINYQLDKLMKYDKMKKKIDYYTFVFDHQEDFLIVKKA